MSKESDKNITIHSIYAKDVSYEAPNIPQMFSWVWQPKVNLDVQITHKNIENDVHEVVLQITVSAHLDEPEASDTKKKNGKGAKEEKTQVAFLIELKFAGMFSVQGIEGKELEKVLSTTSPSILFPYVSETVSSLVSRGGFPQFILPPINFNALYEQKLKEGGAANQDNLS